MDVSVPDELRSSIGRSNNLALVHSLNVMHERATGSKDVRGTLSVDQLTDWASLLAMHYKYECHGGSALGSDCRSYRGLFFVIMHVDQVRGDGLIGCTVLQAVRARYERGRHARGAGIPAQRRARVVLVLRWLVMVMMMVALVAVVVGGSRVALGRRRSAALFVEGSGG